MTKIKPASEIVYPERTDETGIYYRQIDECGYHFYRQDDKKVLHINMDGDSVLINTLPENYFESARQNWSDEFSEIDHETFNKILTECVSKIYE